MINKDSDIIKDQKLKTYYEQLDIQTLLSDFDQNYQKLREKVEKQTVDAVSLFGVLCDASNAFRRIRLHQFTKISGIEMNVSSSSQQRLIKVILCLSKHPIDGLLNKEIAKILKISAVDLTLDLANLAEAGIAELADNGVWQLTSFLPNLGLNMLKSIKEKETRMKSLKHEYTRN